MADGLRFTKVISSSPSGLVVLAEDGNTYTITGDRSQRNNNPGAIAMSPVAAAHGAIGGDNITINGRRSTPIAIFPDMASGQAAQRELLFGDSTNHPQYRNLTLQQAIQKYAPAGVDGNPLPTSYYTKIANSLGVTTDTKLSDLTPAQQQQFMQVQAGIEGSRPQTIHDAQGNRVVLPPMNVPEVGSAYADTSPTPPIPVARSAAIAAINAATNAKRPNGNAGDTLAQNPITTADYGLNASDATINPQFDTLGLATGRDGTPYYALPGAESYGGYIPGYGAGSGTLPSSVPLPRADPRLTPVSPLPRTTLQTPVPTQVASVTPTTPVPLAQPKPTVNINGNTYTVGQVLTNPSNGLSYVVNANGTMTKQPHISLGTNTIASGMAGQAVQSAIQQAQAAAPDLAAKAGGAISGLFGNLFGGGKPVPPMDVPVNRTPSVPQTAGPAGGYYSPPRPSVPQSSGPAGGYYSPPTMPQATANGIDAKAEVADRAQQLALATMGSHTTPTNYGGYIPGGTTQLLADQSNQLTLPVGKPGVAAPTYTTQSVLNPAYTAWQKSNAGYQGYIPGGLPSNDVPQTYGPAGGSYSTPYTDLVSKPATQPPPQYISQKVLVKPSPVVPLSPPQDELAALREQAMNPLQRLFSASPMGSLLNFATGPAAYGGQRVGGIVGALTGGRNLAQMMPMPTPLNNPTQVSLLQQQGYSAPVAYSIASSKAAQQAANPNPVMAAITGNSGSGQIRGGAIA